MRCNFVCHCRQIRSICTLHELDDCLRDFTQNHADFETLKLGPLVKLPLVYQFFKIPQDTDICEMKTADVIEYLRGYLSEKNLWRTKIELEQLLVYIMNKRNLSSPYELGLRISSSALAIQVTALSAVTPCELFVTSLCQLESMSSTTMWYDVRYLTRSVIACSHRRHGHDPVSKFSVILNIFETEQLQIGN